MILDIIAIISFFAAYILSVVRFMHIFQLNSYAAPTQIRWMRNNRSKWLVNVFMAAAALLGALFSALPVTIAALLWGAYLERPQKAKKPLVYTKRVRRMLVTEAVITATVIAAAAFLGGIKSALISMICLYLVSPVLEIAANFINKPIEKSVNNHFISEAKKILGKCPELRIIGVTGSYGKTSVKYYLNTLLRAKYNVLMTPESYNTPMGVVMTIRQHLRATHEIFICEMGAKKVGEIKEICDIVHPHDGVITSIGPQHLETFKSLENVKKTKFELADALPKDGLLFLNGDDENIASYNQNKSAITYSMKNGDYTAFDISVSEKGTKFSVKAPNGDIGSFATKLIGAHNVLNITGAIAIAHTYGVSMTELKPQVRKLECVPHRLQLIDKGSALVIDDAYNSNPSGTKAALDTLKLITGFRILVTPGMVELGEKQDECNREFGQNAAEVCDYVVLVGKKQTESIRQGLADKNYPDDKIFIADNIGEAIAKAYGINSKEMKKIILLENDLPDNY